MNAASAGESAARPPGASARPFLGAILVGGAGRRMGRRKHDLQAPDGRTFAERIRDALREAGAAAVVTVGDATVEGCQGVRDTRPAQGPLAACEALLATGLGDRFIVCPCDMPGVDALLLRRLVEAGDGAVACFHVHGEDRPRPLPMRLDRAALATVVGLLERGERSLRAAVRAAGATIVELDPGSAERLEDVDTPEALASVRERR